MSDSLLINNFFDLVRIDSPSGEESRVALFLQDRLQKLGFITQIDTAGNLFARNSVPGEPVLLNAHMDTVEPGRGIQPRIQNGLLVSDGNTILGADNKSALAAILTALESVDSKQVRPLEILFSVREETDGGVSQFDFSALKSRTGVVADRASRVGSLVLASPWILNLNISILGKGAHSSLPESGINALTIAAKAISSAKWGRIDSQTTSNIGLISGGSAMNSIPEKVTLVGEIRSFNENKLYAVRDQILAIFQKICTKFAANLDFQSSLYCPGYKYSKKDPAVINVVNLFRKLDIKESYEVAFGASDANTITSRGIKIVAIGDGCSHPHTVKESVSISELEKLLAVFQAYIAGD